MTAAQTAIPGTVAPTRVRPSLADVRVTWTRGNATGAARATLLAMHARGKGSATQRIAGRLLATHGDDAMRHVVHCGMGASQSARVVELLQRAGVPSGVA